MLVYLSPKPSIFAVQYDENQRRVIAFSETLMQPLLQLKLEKNKVP